MGSMGWSAVRDGRWSVYSEFLFPVAILSPPAVFRTDIPSIFLNEDNFSSNRKDIGLGISPSFATVADVSQLSHPANRSCFHPDLLFLPYWDVHHNGWAGESIFKLLKCTRSM